MKQNFFNAIVLIVFALLALLLGGSAETSNGDEPAVENVRMISLK